MSVCYLNGEFLNLKDAKISPLDRGFLFGDSIYEVFAAYDKKAFRIEEHLDRFYINLKEIKLTVNISRQELKNIIELVIQKNDLSNQIIYLQISRGYEEIRNHVPDIKSESTVFICSFPLKNLPNHNSDKVKISLREDFRWGKSNIKSTSLLANVLYKIQGNQENLDEIILHDNGYITEGAVSNVFCVKNKKVLTPSLQNNILPGVTRSVIIDIVKKLNIPLAESRISVEDLKNADEVWITNTTKGILLVSEIDQIIFNTLDWITEKSSRTGLTDVENFRTTTYTVGNSGSAYYTVDGINADSTALVIYARVGDKIVFEPTANSVFSAHPFEISTTANDTNGSNNIGSPEGWDQSSHTLTVTDSTPTTLYPHCGVHTGMYTNGRIEIVTTYDQSLIDVESASGGLEVSGTVSVGPFKGASGNTHMVYLRAADAGSDYHEHQFHELPGLTFYMPADQGYHGATNSSGQTKFKTKSHY